VQGLVRKRNNGQSFRCSALGNWISCRKKVKVVLRPCRGVVGENSSAMTGVAAPSLWWDVHTPNLTE
jgi:hypothetical protein